MPWDLTEVQQLVAAFAEDREWSQFHNPKNLSMALAAEAGELLEVFQWLSAEESEIDNLTNLNAATDEIADVFIFGLLLADRLHIDLSDIIEAKIRSNADRYTIDVARGNADKASKPVNR